MTMNMLSLKLSPCPFCGGAPLLHHSDHTDITYVLCDGCGAVVSFRPRKQGAETVEAWNCRAAVEQTIQDAALR